MVKSNRVQIQNQIKQTHGIMCLIAETARCALFDCMYAIPALTGKRGTLDCTADTLISAIALRFIGTDAFSTLPVIVK